MEKKLTATPKYSRGAKVRIRTAGRIIDPELKKYENVAGVVVSSREVVGYLVQPGLSGTSGSLRTALFVYSVETEQGRTLNDLFEYYLELEQSA